MPGPPGRVSLHECPVGPSDVRALSEEQPATLVPAGASRGPEASRQASAHWRSGGLFDRIRLQVMLTLTALSALFAPLVFLGGFSAAVAGGALWGLGMGVHESIIPDAVAPMVPAERRARAYGLFTAGYGLSWFLGSAIIGWLYDLHVAAGVAVSVVLEIAALPFFVLASRAAQGASPASASPA
jgi:hypothetical protein